MINGLNIIHKSHGCELTVPSESEEWKTCLRSIHFLEEQQTATHKGVAAYEFLLEIICGLHSPMLGETEIFSQFKDFLRDKPFLINPKISNRLIQDAKSLRTKFLKSYGSQSYGSYTLNKSKGHEQIVILGAGSLAKEIVPIIKDFPGELVIKTRSPLKSVDLARRFPEVRIEELEDQALSYKNSLLVIAAPISSSKLEKLITKQFNNCSVLDMRSKLDGVPLSLENTPYKTLEEIFSEIEETQKSLQFTTIKMREEIKELSLRWNKKAQVRPFGWEDLCC